MNLYFFYLESFQMLNFFNNCLAKCYIVQIFHTILQMKKTKSKDFYKIFFIFLNFVNIPFKGKPSLFYIVSAYNDRIYI